MRLHDGRIVDIQIWFDHLFGLLEKLSIRFFVEPDEERGAKPDRRCFEVSGRAENRSRQRIVVRRILGHIKRDDVLSSTRHDSFCGSCQFEGGRTIAAVLRSIDDFADSHRGMLKELLSLSAPRSPFSVIHPVDRFWLGHHFPGQLLERTDDQRAIVSAESKAIRDRVADFHFSRLIGNVVQIAGRVRRMVIDRRMSQPVANGQNRRD